MKNVKIDANNTMCKEAHILKVLATRLNLTVAAGMINLLFFFYFAYFSMSLTNFNSKFSSDFDVI